MGRNGNAVPDMGGGHMSESLYDFCRKYMDELEICGDPEEMELEYYD